MRSSSSESFSTRAMTASRVGKERSGCVSDQRPSRDAISNPIWPDQGTSVALALLPPCFSGGNGLQPPHLACPGGRLGGAVNEVGTDGGSSRNGVYPEAMSRWDRSQKALVAYAFLSLPRHASRQTPFSSPVKRKGDRAGGSSGMPAQEVATSRTIAGRVSRRIRARSLLRASCAEGTS